MPDKFLKKGNPNLGHRQRLRLRFQEHNLDNFKDYEALELLLLYVARQKDMKPIAKKLIENFGSFSGVLDATAEDLLLIDGVGESAVTLIQFVKQAAARYLAQHSRSNITPQDVNELINAYRIKLGALNHEKFFLISLNANFIILSENVISDGTIDQSTVYPRKIIEIALKNNATTIMFLHNHPSGDVTPSEMDKIITRNLILATRAIGIIVYDHIIVSSTGFFSFREHSLL